VYDLNHLSQGLYLALGLEPRPPRTYRSPRLSIFGTPNLWQSLRSTKEKGLARPRLSRVPPAVTSTAAIRRIELVEAWANAR